MKPKIICAVDNPDFGYSYSLVSSILEYVHVIKLGLEFFSSCGVTGIEKVAALGLPIFLDLKLHDIPNTVARTISVIKQMECIKFLTVHITGGTEMLMAAKEALQDTGILLIGVSVLTSLVQKDLENNGVEIPLPEYVKKLSVFAKKCGLDGVVCSNQEAHMVRQVCGKEFTIITPGIVSAYSDDQKRVSQISALKNSVSDYIVIGRAITRASDPVKATKEIISSLTNK
ncbi:orotidine-5'-phosphate decarboxylase [Neorickettsia findlayensis]|uniref:Orotidine 5'-phosphate decarboxylase n=1 Tax=Neorickettsia findlayensis TaxID=2686014 RepID=A0A6P1GC91_9RICK|nr:orotidine-5'-phosphate decarboxylase [Neorickettsia findlayensis]QHD65421.1 orotidine-5'-phosphate decarboxylase [Neorickettsia findlayensis]